MYRGGCWIFLSHSSHDIEKVRLVRNEFERLGHNPLAFHLKCLSVDTEERKRELDNLIKREIDARDWFVFCNSPDAENSPYVRDEHAYIVNSGKEKVWSIDMTQDIDSILKKVKQICENIEVYVSYSHRDKNLVKPLIEELINRDYAVWTPDLNLTVGEEWVSQITNAITRCAYKGFYLIVITEESLKSDFVKRELLFASSENATILPVVIGSPDISDAFAYVLSPIQFIYAEPTRESYEKVVDIIDSYIKEQIQNN